jgi:hypothetical protein
MIFSEIKKYILHIFCFQNRGKFYNKTTFHDARQDDRVFLIYAISGIKYSLSKVPSRI